MGADFSLPQWPFDNQGPEEGTDGTWLPGPWMAECVAIQAATTLCTTFGVDADLKARATAFLGGYFPEPEPGLGDES